MYRSPIIQMCGMYFHLSLQNSFKKYLSFTPGEEHHYYGKC